MLTSAFKGFRNVFSPKVDTKPPDAYFETEPIPDLPPVATTKEGGTEEQPKRERKKTEKQKQIDDEKIRKEKQPVDLNSYAISKFTKPELIPWIKDKEGKNEKGIAYTYDDLLKMSDPDLRTIAKSIKDKHSSNKKVKKVKIKN